MRTWTVRLGLSLMMVVGLWTNRAPAQENVGPYPSTQVYVVPTVPVIPEYPPSYPPPLYPRPQSPPSKSPVVRTLNHFGLGCQADSFGSVGSFWSEFRWAYGSSRSFFEERCIPCGQPGADGRNP
jgi:hypothetical protein